MRLDGEQEWNGTSHGEMNAGYNNGHIKVFLVGGSAGHTTTTTALKNSQPAAASAEQHLDGMFDAKYVISPAAKRHGESSLKFASPTS